MHAAHDAAPVPRDHGAREHRSRASHASRTQPCRTGNLAAGTVGLLAMASADVRGAIERAATYHRVVKDDASTRLTETREGMLLEELLPSA